MTLTEDDLHTFYQQLHTSSAAEDRIRQVLADAPPTTARRSAATSIRWRPAAVAGIAAVLTAAIVLVAVDAGRNHQDAPPRPGSSSGELPDPSGAQPSVYVAFARDRNQQPGVITVRNSRTGKIVRTLGTAHYPGPVNGFALSPDRRTLYYVRLNPSRGSHNEIVAVPISGGPGRVVADGHYPRPSPDGTRLAFVPDGSRSVSVVDLATGDTGNHPLPSSTGGRYIYGLSWLNDAATVVVDLRTPAIGASCPAGIPCPTDRDPATAGAFALATRDGSVAPWRQLPELQTQQPIVSWATVNLVGPASSNKLYVYSCAVGDPPLLCSLDTVDPATGHILQTIRPPAGHFLAALDASGRHLLLSHDGDIESWTEGDRKPRHVSSDVTNEAAW